MRVSGGYVSGPRTGLAVCMVARALYGPSSFGRQRFRLGSAAVQRGASSFEHLSCQRSPFTAWRSALAKRGSIPSGELTGNDSFSVLLFAGKRLARVFCWDGADKGETKSTTRVRDQGLVSAKAKLPASHTSSCSLSQLTIRKHNHQGGEFMQSLGEAPMRRAH